MASLVAVLILALGCLGQAADLLFLSTLTGVEISIARKLQYSIDVLDPKDWATKQPDFFKSYKAIVVGDPNSSKLTFLDPLVSSRKSWSPAITGNIILMGKSFTSFHHPICSIQIENGRRFSHIPGTDPADSTHRPRSHQLVSNGIKYVASGHGTGLYMVLSTYYQTHSTTKLEVMQEFGNFTVRGTGCYDAAHLVSNNSLTDRMTDTLLSNWTCSIHEGFVEFPQGLETRHFEALAIALNFQGEGIRNFTDGTIGLPYIIATNSSGPIPVPTTPHQPKDSDIPKDPEPKPSPKPPVCQLCNPSPPQNFCHETTACSSTPYGFMCLARAGFKANDVTDDDANTHWRLDWPGQEFRVAVAPGKKADTTCSSPMPYLCSEVSIGKCGHGGSDVPKRLGGESHQIPLLKLQR